MRYPFKVIYLSAIAFTNVAVCQVRPTAWAVEPTLSVGWDEVSGVPYSQVPGANLGAVAFAVISDTQIALLCNNVNEVRVFSTTSNDLLQKFTVGFSPRDIVFLDSTYYVMFDHQITVHSAEGQIRDTIPIPSDVRRFTRLAVIENAVWLWLSSGNSLLIQKDGIAVKEERVGWIGPTGDFIYARITDGLADVALNGTRENESIRFGMSKKIAGIFPIGLEQDRIILDVQTFIAENPVEIERHYVAVAVGAGDVTMLKAPDVYYVHSDRDILQDGRGGIWNMVTAPDGVHVFRLNACANAPCIGYPQDLMELEYHFNYHLLKLD